MSIEKFTYRLAFVWLCFRMVADMASKLTNGLIALVGNIIHLAFSMLLMAAIIAGGWWIWAEVIPKH